MVFCESCRKDVRTIYDYSGILSCSICGKVLQYDNFTTETTFVKDKSGQSRALGTIVRTIESENISRQRLYDRAEEDMTFIKNGLGMGENQAIVQQAMVYYKIAVERNFTKGRRTDQVQAACLYIACRENRKPYLLIDFSNYLRINIYVLGAVFLQLCKVLNLTEHAICQKLLDPSIFIHKYTASLSGGKNKEISDDALTIIASMNHHWIQTGRRPSALWGAALYISALSHGFNCSKSDILRLVHVCEKTLSKRLVEFENTESGSLTVIGFEGGSDPPAFQNAKRQRMEKSSIVDESAKESNSLRESRDNGRLQPICEPENVEVVTGYLASGPHKPNGADDTGSKAFDESDNFSDIDDAEVDSYLHNEEEKRYKKIIWEEMNREYLLEQEAKEAAAATLKEAWEGGLKNCPEDMQAARKLDAAVKAELAKSKKEMQQKRAAEAKNSGPAKSAAEAVHRMLTKKRLSSKINYDVLEKLFEDPEAKDTKKSQTEKHFDGVNKEPCKDGKDRELDDGLGPVDQDEEDPIGNAYDDYLYDENANYDDEEDGNNLW